MVTLRRVRRSAGGAVVECIDNHSIPHQTLPSLAVEEHDDVDAGGYRWASHASNGSCNAWTVPGTARGQGVQACLNHDVVF